MNLPKTQQVVVDRMKAENLAIQKYFGVKKITATLVRTNDLDAVKNGTLNIGVVEALIEKKIVKLVHVDHNTGVTKHYFQLV